MKTLSFKHEDISILAKSAGTICNWDFAAALGDTILEKYESLYVKVIELNQVMLAKGAEGYFWIVASPEVASIFEVARAGFSPATSYATRDDEPVMYQYSSRVNHDELPVQYVGSINHRWKLYKDAVMEPSTLLMGVGNRALPPENYGVMKLSNFIT